MLDAALKALHFINGKNKIDYETDELLVLALVRLIEIIGEAANKVTAEFKERFPNIPWNEIIGTRNHLIHGYEDVNLDILWQIVSVDLVNLSQDLQKIVDQETNNEQLRLI